MIWSRLPGTSFQSKPLPSPFQRGMRWRWKCATDWKAAPPLAWSRLSPSGLSACWMAAATFLAATMIAWRSSTSDSWMVAACALVTTRQCPELRGLMSMNVRVRSSSWILNEGICPSRILQNTQSMGSPWLDLERPAVRVRRPGVLDAHDGVVESLRQRPDAAVLDDHSPAPVGQLAHRRDDGGGAGAEHFRQLSIPVGLHHLLDGDRPLGGLHPPLAEEGEHRIARDAGQDGAAQLGGEDLVPDLHHD